MLVDIFYNKFKRYLQILLFASIVFSLFISGEVYGFHLLSLLIGFICYYSGYYFYIATKKDNEAVFYGRLFFISFIFTTLFLFLIAEILLYARGIPYVALDDVIYDTQQKNIYSQLVRNGISSGYFLTGSYSGYPNLGAIFMYLLDNNEWYIPRLMTVFMMSISSVLLYSTLKQMYSVNSSRIMSIFFAFTPLYSFYSIVQLKDYVIIFILIVFFFSLVSIYNKKRILISLLLAIVALVSLLFFRPAIIFSLLVSLLIWGLFIKKKSGYMSKMGVLFLSIFVLYYFFYLWSSLSDIGFASRLDDYLDSRMEMIVTGNKLIGENSRHITGFWMKLIGMPFYATLSPFLPVPTCVLFIDPLYPALNYEYNSNIFLYAILPFFLASLWYVILHRKEFSIELYFVIFFFVYKFGQATTMSVFGLRQSLPGILCVMYLLPIVFHKKIPTKHYKLIFIALLVLVFLWAFIRQQLRS